MIFKLSLISNYFYEKQEIEKEYQWKTLKLYGHFIQATEPLQGDSLLVSQSQKFLVLIWANGGRGEAIWCIIVCVCVFVFVCVCVCGVCVGGPNLKVSIVDWNNKLKTNTYLLFALTNTHTRKNCTLISSLYFFFR